MKNKHYHLLSSIMLAAAPSFCEARQVNGPLEPSGSVSTVIVSPDGNSLLYSSRSTHSGLWESPLYSVTITGLNHTRLLDQTLEEPTFSPDGNHVVFLERRPENQDKYQISRISPNGGNITKLRDINTINPKIQITNDSKFVIYSDKEASSSKTQLFRLPIEGGDPEILNGPVDNNEGLIWQTLSPDRSRLIYRSNEGDGASIDLYSVPVSGGPPTKINPELIPGGNVTSASFSPDGNFIIYQADQETDELFEYYSVPATGGTSTKIASPANTLQKVTLFGYPNDGSHAIFSESVLFETQSFFRVSIDGSQRVELAPSFFEDSQLGADDYSIKLSPDGSKIALTIFTGTWDSGFTSKLYSIPTNGDDAILLAENIPKRLSRVAFSPDNQRIVATTTPFTSTSGALFSFSSDGTGDPVILSPAERDFQAIYPIQFSSDGQFLFFTAYSPSEFTTGIYRVSSTGGPLVKLNADIEPYGQTNETIFLLNGNHLVFTGTKEGEYARNLYSVPTTGGVPLQLNEQLNSDQRLRIPEQTLSLENDHLIYTTNPQLGTADIYRAPFDGAPPRRIATIDETDHFNQKILTNEDWSKIVYVRGNQVYSIVSPNAAPLEIYSVPDSGERIQLSGLSPDTNQVAFIHHRFDGSKLFTLPLTGGDVSEPIIDDETGSNDPHRAYYSPNGNHILYLASIGEEQQIALFSVPTSGGNPVRISPDIPGIGSVSSNPIRFTPDSSRVIFDFQRSNTANSEFFTNEVYSAPVIGGEAVALISNLPTDLKVFKPSYIMSPDGSEIAYTIGRTPMDEVGIYRVPTTGGEAQALPSPGENAEFLALNQLQYNKDGSRLLYFIIQQSEDLTYSRHINSTLLADGSTTTLSENLITDSRLGGEFMISNDNQNVFFTAQEDDTFVSSLYITNQSGGDIIKLSGDLDIDSFYFPHSLRESNDGSKILFNITSFPGTTSRLFITDLTERIPVQLTDGKTFINSDFRWSPDENQIFYVSDENTSGIFELFSTSVDGFDSFQAYHGLTATSVDDSDGDGLSDGLEYALNLDPTSQSNISAPLNFEHASGEILLSSALPPSRARDATLTIEATNSLHASASTWSNIATRMNGTWLPEGSVSIETDGKVTLRNVRAVDVKRFYRLKVDISE